ncbi:MAG: NAD-dependent epimerase/dehydratase family protein [Chloroflexi bacterium]|nr:NAD-dependent epimerase/dehydratase family protein [Chloroflexota bacterium]
MAYARAAAGRAYAIRPYAPLSFPGTPTNCLYRKSHALGTMRAEGIGMVESVERKRILLTGAATTLGAAVAGALAQEGHVVRATDSAPLAPEPADDGGEAGGANVAGGDGGVGRATGRAALAADFREGALTDPEFVAPLLDGVEAIVHLAPLALVEPVRIAAAGTSPGELLDTAARGTHVLYKAAVEAGVGLAVQGSTLAVMDAYDDSLEVTEVWRPRPRPVPAEMAPYLAELTAREFTRDVQLDAPLRIVCLRFAPPAHRSAAVASVDPADRSRTLDAGAAAHAVVRALDALRTGARQRGHRWQLYHIAPASPFARYTSAAARRALGYAEGEREG